MIDDRSGELEQKRILLTDRYAEDRPPGGVIGTATGDGAIRGGIDREGVLSIDNGALRIQPLLLPGWGRAGLAYGPYRREPGLALAVFMLNGHNTAQAGNLQEGFADRLVRWWIGSETYTRGRRIVQWMQSKRKSRLVRQLRWWWRLRGKRAVARELDENLAVGWFPLAVPGDPRSQGNSLVMHATGAENGELWARVGTAMLPAVRSVQNLQMYYAVILRARGAAYYVASVPDAHGVGPYPSLRPLAIDPEHRDEAVYAGIFQSVLGQIGFRLDTRVYGTRIAHIPEAAEWYGTAHAADSLLGSGRLSGSAAERGGSWAGGEGFERDTTGARVIGLDNMALLDPGSPAGLIHLVVEASESAAGFAGVVWRARDDDNCWCLLVGAEGCELLIREEGRWSQLAQNQRWRLVPGRRHSVQILDDGTMFSTHLDGDLLFGSRFTDPRLREATRVGLWASVPDERIRLRAFEAHPRSVPLPAVLDLGAPWRRFGDRIVVSDDFEGEPRELSGRVTEAGHKVWRKEIGSGVIEAGNGLAQIRASRERPNPGRTAYTIDWDEPDFVDMEVRITPPGSGRGQREQGLCGFILWQDPDNYITLNTWIHDTYEGASISTFFHLDGFEDLYDAIWSNVGARLRWGEPHTLRVVFDGMRYSASINGEPVLYRALTDVYADCQRKRVTRIGLLANWEWGNDTGSIFRAFRARI
jgi:hypothetical protein